MIVEQIGYLKLDDVKKLEHFSIYKTHKNTNILIKDTSQSVVCIFRPKQDRLPWKIIEGKSICTCEKIFDSQIDSIDSINTKDWNNGNQIMAYCEFTYLRIL